MDGTRVWWANSLQEQQNTQFGAFASYTFMATLWGPLVLSQRNIHYWKRPSHFGMWYSLIWVTTTPVWGFSSVATIALRPLWNTPHAENHTATQENTQYLCCRVPHFSISGSRNTAVIIFFCSWCHLFTLSGKKEKKKIACMDKCL